jgi:hypothetical protein
MSLTTVLSVSLIPAKARGYEEGVRRIADKARERRDAFQWRAYQVVAGQQGILHFVSQAQDFATLAKRDVTPQALVLRLLGEQEGAKIGEQLASCATASRYTIARERPDLSYPPESRTEAYPMSVVTVLRARPGHQDAAEELIRKIAEAIPKVDDPARLVAYQTMIGDLRTYWTVRPIRSLADLDQQLAPGDLLTKAFGAAEGGLISRSGMEALELAERSITLLRPELSNPS